MDAHLYLRIETAGLSWMINIYFRIETAGLSWMTISISE